MENDNKEKPKVTHIKVYPRTEDERETLIERAREEGHSASSWFLGLGLRELKKKKGGR